MIRLYDILKKIKEENKFNHIIIESAQSESGKCWCLKNNFTKDYAYPGNYLDPMSKMFSAIKFEEANGNVILTLQEFNLTENGKNIDEALFKLAVAIKEYAEDFIKDPALRDTKMKHQAVNLFRVHFYEEKEIMNRIGINVY